jgi:hypothetical protein
VNLVYAGAERVSPANIQIGIAAKAIEVAAAMLCGAIDQR